MKIIKGLLTVLLLVLVGLGAYYTQSLLIPFGGVVFGMFLFQAAGGAGVVTSHTMTWVPQYLFFVAAATPTALKCNVLGDGVIHDTVAAQLDLMPTIRQYGRIANAFNIPLSNGLIKGKNHTIDFTNAGAPAIDVYGYSMRTGNAYVTTLQQTVLANSGAEFRRFAYLVVPAMGATDYINVEFRDGTVQRFEQEEIPTIAGFYQNLVAAQYIIDNINQEIRMVQLIPAANRVVAVVRYVKA